MLIDAHPRNAWLLGAVYKRLREEFAKLQVEINEVKSRIVDLARGETFGFLGFDFRRLRSIKGQMWCVHHAPMMKKRTALLHTLKDVFRRFHSQPVELVIPTDQPDTARLGELLRHRTLRQVLRLRSAMGRKEGSTPYSSVPETVGLRLEEME